MMGATALLAWWLASAEPVDGPAPPARPETLVERAWTVEDGLPQDSVQALAQTPDGFLWVGTEGGLARFDGVTFKLPAELARQPWSGRGVRALRVDRTGALWIGTRDGLARFDGTGDPTWFDRRDGLPSADVLALHEDPQGRLWVGTQRGLAVRQEDRFVPLVLRDDGRQPGVLALAGNADRLWVGTDRGLVRVERVLQADRAIRWYGVDDGLNAPSVQALLIDRQGRVWIGSRGNGAIAARWEDERLTPLPTPSPFARAWDQDAEGNVWVGSRAGVVRWIGDQFQPVQGAGTRVSREPVSTLFRDREGHLWIGGEAAGLARLSRAPFRLFTERDGLPGRRVTTVLADRQGAIWFGTWGRGLARFEGARVQKIFPEVEDLVRALAFDRDGTLWVGTSRPDGLLSVRADRAQREPALSAPVTALATGSDGLWIGTERGLRAPKGTQVDASGDDPVRALVAAPDGCVYVAAADHLWHRCGERSRSTRSWPLPAQLRGRRIDTLGLDDTGAVWLAAAPWLARWREPGWQLFGEAHGLPSVGVCGIADDGRGHLWLATGRGLVQIPRHGFDQVAAGASARLAPVTFARLDGIGGAVCEDGAPAVTRDANGQLWFATRDGLLTVDPTQVAPSGQPPSVVLEALLADGVRLDPRQPTQLPAGIRHLELAFTAPSFRAPERLRFRYRLDGFDTRWLEPTTLRTARYSGLRAGRYRFVVQAVDEAGRAGPEVSSSELIVAAHLHERWSVRGGALVLLLLGAWQLVRLRERVLARRHALVLQERDRVARELHDTLLQGQAGLVHGLHAAKRTLARDPEAAARQLDELAADAGQGLSETRRAIMDLRLPGLASQELATVLQAIGPTLPGPTRPALQVQVDPSLAAADALDPALKETLARIAGEAALNAARHGRARQITVTVSSEAGGIIMTVRDDGAGFDPAAVARSGRQGFGLTGMRERARRLGGSLEIESRPGGGTAVSVTLPRVRRGGST